MLYFKTIINILIIFVNLQKKLKNIIRVKVCKSNKIELYKKLFVINNFKDLVDYKQLFEAGLQGSVSPEAQTPAKYELGLSGRLGCPVGGAVFPRRHDVTHLNLVSILIQFNTVK